MAPCTTQTCYCQQSTCPGAAPAPESDITKAQQSPPLQGRKPSSGTQGHCMALGFDPFSARRAPSAHPVPSCTLHSPASPPIVCLCTHPWPLAMPPKMAAGSTAPSWPGIASDMARPSCSASCCCHWGGSRACTSPSTSAYAHHMRGLVCVYVCAHACAVQMCASPVCAWNL